MNLRFSAMLSLVAFSASAQAPLVAERPVLTAGDTWTYVVSDVVPKNEWRYTRQIESKAEKNYVSRVTIENAKGVTTASSNLSLDLNRLRVVKGEQSDSGWLQFPLTIGKKWKARELWEDSGGNGHEDITYVVVGTEKLTVGAGTFDTFKIEGEGWWVNDVRNTGGKIEATFWYAPETKWFIRYGGKRWFRDRVVHDSNTTLVNFQLHTEGVPTPK